MEARPESGDRAPDFDLIAAGSGRRVRLRGLAGRRVVLVFHLQGTAPTARGINRAVRERFPDPEEVFIASVIDLSVVPPAYWMTVGLVLGSAYEQRRGSCLRTWTRRTTSRSCRTEAVASAATTAFATPAAPPR